MLTIHLRVMNKLPLSSVATKKARNMIDILLENENLNYTKVMEYLSYKKVQKWHFAFATNYFQHYQRKSHTNLINIAGHEFAFLSINFPHNL